MEVSRRSFLRAATIGAGGLALGGALGASQLPTKVFAASESFPGHPDRMGMLTDMTVCIGCRACERACNRAYNLPPPEKRFADPSVFEELRRPSAEQWTVVNRYPNPVNGGNPIYRRVQCMHCDEPACVSACLVGALTKSKEGPVIYNADVCIGCRYCMNACPFYMLSFEYDKARPSVRKCVMCFDQIKEGNIPACASACSTGATIFGKRSDLLETAKKRIYANPGRYVNSVFGEREAGGTGWLYLSPVPFEDVGFHTDVGAKPYPEYTREWLLGVPIVIIGWPALLLGLNALSKRKEQVSTAAAEPKKGKE